MEERGVKKYITLAIFLGPALVGVGMFLIVPIFMAFGYSLTNYDLLSSMDFIGIKNYMQLFQSEIFLVSFKNTFVFLGVYLIPVIVFGFFAAVLLNKKIKFRGLYRSLFFLPVITSWVAVSMVWMWLYNKDYGIINYALSLLRIAPIDWLNNPDIALYSIIVTSIWKDLGFVSVILLAALQDIDGSLFEAASIAGASRMRTLRSITLPSIMPQVFFVIIISSINSFQVFDQIQVMTQGKPSLATTTVMINIYNNAFSYYKMGYASAMSFVLFVVILCYSQTINFFQRRVNYYEN